MKKDGYGFTIVELLIVIVVIAVLAVVSMVTYANFQSRAHASVVQSDLTNAMKKLKLHRVTEAYPTTTDQLRALDITVGKGSYDTGTPAYNFYYCLNRITDEVSLGGRSVNGDGYIITSSKSLTKTSASNASTCQAIDLADASDPNGDTAAAYAGPNGWQSWIN